MMQKRIVIYLHPANPLQASWVILDDAKQISQSVADRDLTELSALAKDVEIIVIVPSQDVLLMTAELPKLSAQRLKQALPFALEEQLIDDVTDLHFAIGNYQPDGTLPVAIVSHKKMLEWITTLKQVGIAPQYLIPSVFLLPFNTENWYANSHDNICLARTSQFSGFACEKENEDFLLDLTYAENPESNSRKLVHTHFSNQELLEKNAGDITATPFINLLQGSYQAKRQTTKIKKIWLLTSFFAITWIVLAFLSNIIAFFILYHQDNKIETAIEQIYKRNFPQAKSIVAPKERMTDKLKTLAGNANKNNFLALLGAIGKGLSEAPGVRVQGLDFREHQLTLELSAASFDNLDSFTRVLTQLGLSVKQQNAAIAGSQVKSTFLIHAGSS